MLWMTPNVGITKKPRTSSRCDQPQEIVRVPSLQVFQGRTPAQASVHRLGVPALLQRERPLAEVLLGKREGEPRVTSSRFCVTAPVLGVMPDKRGMVRVRAMGG